MADLWPESGHTDRHSGQFQFAVLIDADSDRQLTGFWPGDGHAPASAVNAASRLIARGFQLTGRPGNRSPSRALDLLRWRYDLRRISTRYAIPVDSSAL